MIVHELVAAKDYRQDRLSGAQVYFTPDDTADMSLSDIWTKLSDGKREGLSLKVKGREVRLEDYASGVARTSFAELCGQALGAADYLALAQAVRVLILTHVPVLAGRHHNEARRFVTLVDALYEARVQVILSADAAPEELYGEGAGRFEFERTASRLREMQDADWGTT
jgi:cell division protein ZapE